MFVQDGWILAKHFFLWGQYPAILTEQAWSIYYMAQKRTFTCGNNTGFPNPILPAQAANQNAGFASSCPFEDSAM